ncbi:palmdelphin isoform X4 [Pangasianodon hypophthalmus]|uniref:palmdelphin isoform X4 n=1 Tax=Pangasianodon hypophthalmus TaxID=310915 RepID=UPI0023072AB7|nr:palmdelphin isoform X4 [Pangasianodon hypophthalmus]
MDGRQFGEGWINHVILLDIFTSCCVFISTNCISTQEVNGDVQREMIQYIYSTIPDIPESYTPTLMRRINTPEKDSDSEAQKEAIYAMEISVEKDLRTGKSQVLSTASVTPQEFQEKGIKVYDDGRKSVYAVQSAGKESEDAIDELSPLEVEELLRKATAKKDPTDVEYHEPVFSSPYSRSSTPQKVERGMVSPGPNGFHIQGKTPSPLQPDSQISQHQEDAKAMLSPTPDHVNYHMYKYAVNRQGSDGVHTNKAELMQELKEQKRLIPVSDSQLGFERYSPFNPREDVCFCVENSFPSEMDCNEPVTMIFMGYQNAESDEENDAIQAELVVIGDEEEDDEEPSLSYHPQGYHSKVFQPKNDNLHRSEVRHGFIKSPSSGGHLTKYGTQNTETSVLKMKQPQLRKCAVPAQGDPRLPYTMKT